MTRDQAIAAAFDRHEGHVALQLSGGRDSLAVLFDLERYWERLTVYHVTSGDAYPETQRLIWQIHRTLVPVVVIEGRQPQVLREQGWPTDSLPVGSTVFGQMLGHAEPPMVDRYTCCGRSLMQPMHERMLADGITLIIRGQKNDDALKPPLRSGDTADGFEFLYPMETWSAGEVMALVDAVGKAWGLDIPPYYAEGMTSAPDCMHCTAWLEHRGPQYLRRHHPEVGRIVASRLRLMSRATQPLVDRLADTLTDLETS